MFRARLKPGGIGTVAGLGRPVAVGNGIVQRGHGEGSCFLLVSTGYWWNSLNDLRLHGVREGGAADARSQSGKRPFNP